MALQELGALVEGTMEGIVSIKMFGRSVALRLAWGGVLPNASITGQKISKLFNCGANMELVGMNWGQLE